MPVGSYISPHLTYISRFDKNQIQPCILEVPDSYLGLDTGYPDWYFSLYYSVHSRKCRDSTWFSGHVL